MFFVFLFSILTTLYDRYRPIKDYRGPGAAQTEAKPETTQQPCTETP